MNNSILDFEKCANCGACYNICPKKAITVDETDWYYKLQIDESKCISCGVCKQICPVNNPINSQKIIGTYGAIHNNDEIVLKSSSGGVFSAIAQYIIDNGGIVYGACYSDDFSNVNICSSETHTIDQIRRSKYVESKANYSFLEIKEKLLDNKLVLYCGAPCQIAGLKRFLKEDYKNLITCDFSCGGLPSHKMYQEYLSNVKKKLKAKSISEVNFRPKIFGWETHAIKIKANSKVYKKWAFADEYFSCFLKQRLSIRDYCYECSFSNNHYSDIILADLWKYKSISKIKNDNKGISLVITNSTKGEEIINKVKKLISLTVLDIEKASYNLVERNLNEKLFIEHKEFVVRCKEKGFINAMRKYKLKNSLLFNLKYYAKKFLRKVR